MKEDTRQGIFFLLLIHVNLSSFINYPLVTPSQMLQKPF